MVHRRKAPPPRDIAIERIEKLSKLARVTPDKEYSRRYMRLAETLAKRIDISLPTDIKRSFCKKCGLPYGKLTKVRLKRGLCIITCSHCNDLRRIPYRN